MVDPVPEKHKRVEIDENFSAMLNKQGAILRRGHEAIFVSHDELDALFQKWIEYQSNGE